MTSYTIIGKLNKSFGDRGGIRFSLFQDYIDVFNEKDYIFLLLEGIYVPFFKDKDRSHTKDLIFLQDITNNDEVDEIAARHIYLPDSDLKHIPIKESDLKYHYLEGYEAYEMNETLIGSIAEVQQYPMQEMAIISGSESILIPLNEELISHIDTELKKVFFDLPEGLITKN